MPRKALPENLPKRRITIFGGRVRDESKYTDQIDTDLFDVRWMVCERNHGSADYQILNNALKHTDAAIVVVAMVSHTTMWRVKRYSQVHGVPWTPVRKLTIRQLKKAMTELFPDTAQQHPSTIDKRYLEKEKPL